MRLKKRGLLFIKERGTHSRPFHRASTSLVLCYLMLIRRREKKMIGVFFRKKIFFMEGVNKVARFFSLKYLRDVFNSNFVVIVKVS